MPTRPDWLDVVRHRVRGLRVPFLLIVQHHAIPSSARLAAPVSAPLPGDVDVLAPRVSIEGVLYRVRLLNMSAVPLTLIGETVTSVANERDAILGAIDVILRGYPVGHGRLA